MFYAEDGATHGTIENLSATGALVSVAGVPSEPRSGARTGIDSRGEALDVELKLGTDSGWVSAHTVRVERPAASRGRFRIAVAFDQLDPAIRSAIDHAIEAAVLAAQRRPILVIDDRVARRVDLVTRLAARGMTPLAPRTPLEAIDLLTRTQLHVNVCLLASSFGQSAAELSALVAESFPWVATTEITDDVDATVDRAIEAWAGTDVARLSRAIA